MNRGIKSYLNLETSLKFFKFLRSYLIFILTIPLTIPILFFLKLINSFINIRFGMIRNDVIGHYVFDTEYYLAYKEIKKIQSLDFLFFQKINSNPNKQWTKMLKRKLIISEVNRAFYFICKKIKIFESFLFVLNDVSNRDIENVLNLTKSHFNFTNAEEEIGYNFLKSLGIKKNQEFVCIMSRDSRYKKRVNKYNDMSYHNYRNSNIDNYCKTINYLTNKGYFVFRMGKYVEKKIEIKNNLFLDYANSKFRNDFLDIFLSAKCKMFINGESGLCNVAVAYRRPLVMVNFSALEYIFNFYSLILTIPKKYYNLKTNKLITFNEIFKNGYGKYLKSNLYTNAKIKLIENTPEEILDATNEMLLILENKKYLNDSEIALQNKFWELLPKSNLHGELNGAILGNKFLLKNLDLFD